MTVPRAPLKFYIARKMLQVHVQRLETDTMVGGEKFTAAIFLPAIARCSDELV
jgi:hypothetical protein